MRWCRGSVADQIFRPWRARLEAGGARLLGGRRAMRVLPNQAGRRRQVLCLLDKEMTLLWRSARWQSRNGAERGHESKCYHDIERCEACRGVAQHNSVNKV